MENQLGEVNKLIENGDYATADQVLKNILKKNKDDKKILVKSILFTSKSYFFKGEYEKAIVTSENAIRLCKELHYDSLLINSIFTKLEGLIYAGKQREALNELQDYKNYFFQYEKNKNKVSQKILITYYRIQGDIYRGLGRDDQAEPLFQKSLAIAIEVQDELEIAYNLDSLAMVAKSYDLDKSLSFLERSLNIRKNHSGDLKIAETLNRIGIVYQNRGDLEIALEFYRNSLDKGIKYQNKDFLSIIKNNVGIIYKCQGRLNQALSSFSESYDLSRESGNKHVIVGSVFNIAETLKYKGELDEALDSYKKIVSVIKDLNNPNYYVALYLRLGQLYLQKGNLEQAEEYLLKGMRIRKKITRNQSHVTLLHFLVKLSIEKKNLSQAEEYVQQIKEIRQVTDDNLTNLLFKLSKALVLKESARASKRTEAETLLRQIIVSDELIDIAYILDALLNLGHLLIEELRISGEENLLDDIENIISKLLELGRNRKFFVNLAEIYWLKAEVSIVQLKLNEAKMYLIQALLFAEEMGLHRLTAHLAEQYDTLLDHYAEWENMSNKNIPIQDRVKFFNLNGLAKRLTKQEEIESISPKPERPIFLIILNQHGKTFYSKKFIEETQLDEGLIAAFISAINSFAGEVFETSGHIERITQKEFSIAVKSINDMLIGYIYQGSSYHAVKKLSNLLEKISLSKVILGKMLQHETTPKPLDNISKNLLTNIIEKVFI